MSSKCDDGETDIYGDLPNFQFDEAFKKLEHDKADLQNKVQVLASKLEEMKKENEKLAAKVRALGKNISCLYKTAQREIERKEEIIAELRRERDDLLFRRGVQDYKPSNLKLKTKKPSRKQLTPTKKVRNGGLKKVLNGKETSEGVNDERITPSAKEYEQITSLSTVGTNKSKTAVNAEVRVAPEVVDIDSDSSGDSTKNVKSSEEVGKTDSSMEKCTLSANKEVMPEENERSLRCDDLKAGKTKDKEPGTVSPVTGSESAKEGEESISDSNSRTVTEVVANDLSKIISKQTPDKVSEDGKSSGCTNNSKIAEMTSPVKDKISVHMSSEDCGFGRRRVRRVIKPSLSPAVARTSTSTSIATVITSAATTATTSVPTTANTSAATMATATPTGRGVKRPHEETPVADREILQQPQLLEVEVKLADPRIQKRRCVDGALVSINQENELENTKDDSGVESNRCRLGIQTDSCGRKNSDDLIVLRYDDTKGKNKNKVGSGGEFKSNDTKETHDKDGKIMRKIVKDYGSSFGVSAYEGKTNRPMHGSEVFSPDEPDGEGTVRKPKANCPSSTYAKERDYSRKGEYLHCDKDYITPPQSSLSPSSDIRSPIRLSPCDRITDDEPSSRRSWDRERISESSLHGGRRRHATGGGFRANNSCPQKGWDDGECPRDFWESSDTGKGAVRQGRADAPLERNGDPERGHHRGRDKSRDYGRARSRERSEDRVRDKSWDRSMEMERSRGRERGRGKKSFRGRGRGRGGKMNRSWDRGSRRSRDRSWEHNVGRSGGRSRERERRSRDYDGERDWMRNERDRGYDRARDREYDRRWEAEKVRIFNMGRNSVLGERDSDRAPDLDRSRDRERERETSRGSKESDGSRDGGRVKESWNVNSYGSRSTESSPGMDEGRGLDQTKGDDDDPSDGRYDLRKKLNDSGSDPNTCKDPGQNREGGRVRENRNISSCQSQNVVGGVRKGEGKGFGKMKPNEKPSDGHNDLRKKLMETNVHPKTRIGVNKDKSGYKDLDQPSNDVGNLSSKPSSSGPVRAKTRESNDIRSPDDRRNCDPREIIPYVSEWD